MSYTHSRFKFDAGGGILPINIIPTISLGVIRMSNYEKIFSTVGVNESGREGRSYIEGKDFEVNIAAPDSKQKDATNPEELFALGYSACFNGALQVVLKEEDVKGKSVVRHEVDLLKGEGPDFKLGVTIEVGIEGLESEEVQPLADKAHEICPYSRAVQNGHIDVEVKGVTFKDA
jgi:peroxiredoxin, ohr subfamily